MWFKEVERDPEKLKMMRLEFQEMLGTETGQRVFTKMLSDSYFFRESTTPEEVALNNHAKKLLFNAGIWVPGNELEIVRSLIRVGVVTNG